MELQLPPWEGEPLIFDSHAHYDDKKFADMRDTLLRELPRYGVAGIINCGVNLPSSRAVVSYAQTYDYCYAAVGVHPEDLPPQGVFDPAPFAALARLEKTVAIGEIGLDYYWTKDNMTAQQEWLGAQLALAKELDLPVIVHDRDAHADTLAILKHYRPRGVVHCFSGSAELAAEVVKLGMYIGIGGVVTYPTAKKTVAVAQNVPADRLLLETDAPYLPPVPFRGKLCHSGMIAFTAETIATLRGVSMRDLCRKTMQNAMELFSILY